MTIDEIANIIGVDSLGYLPVAELWQLTGSRHYCDACFTGHYPTAIPANSGRGRFEQKLSERQN